MVLIGVAFTNEILSHNTVCEDHDDVVETLIGSLSLTGDVIYKYILFVRINKTQKRMRHTFI